MKKAIFRKFPPKIERDRVAQFFKVLSHVSKTTKKQRFAENGHGTMRNDHTMTTHRICIQHSIAYSNFVPLPLYRSTISTNEVPPRSEQVPPRVFESGYGQLSPGHMFINVVLLYMCKERSSTNLRHSPAFPAIKQALLPLFQNRT